MKIIKTILLYFSPCKRCKEKNIEGLIACSCRKGIFEKKWQKKES